MTAQTAGLVLLAVAGFLLWSPWSFVIAGVLLLIVPEVIAGVRRGDRSARRRT